MATAVAWAENGLATTLSLIAPSALEGILALGAPAAAPKTKPTLSEYLEGVDLQHGGVRDTVKKLGGGLSSVTLLNAWNKSLADPEMMGTYCGLEGVLISELTGAKAGPRVVMAAKRCLASPASWKSPTQAKTMLQRLQNGPGYKLAPPEAPAV